MGQQQLILLVLGIVIVGLGIVVGLNAFDENQRRTSVDALTQDIVRIAGDAQAWRMKPDVYGGGGGAFDGVSFAGLGYADTGGTYTNTTGAFTMDVDGSDLTIVGVNGGLGTGAAARVCGLTANDIVTVAGDATVTAPAACP
jgi:hypothetical protein